LAEVAEALQILGAGEVTRPDAGELRDDLLHVRERDRGRIIGDGERARATELDCVALARDAEPPVPCAGAEHSARDVDGALAGHLSRLAGGEPRITAVLQHVALGAIDRQPDERRRIEGRHAALRRRVTYGVRRRWDLEPLSLGLADLCLGCIAQHDIIPPDGTRGLQVEELDADGCALGREVDRGREVGPALGRRPPGHGQRELLPFGGISEQDQADHGAAHLGRGGDLGPVPG